MSQDPASLTAAIHASFCAGHLEACLEMADPDVEVVFQPTGQTVCGREGFLQLLQGFHTAFPDIQIRHTRTIVGGDDIAVEFTWTGTHTGPLMTPAGAVAPTAKAVRDGRVCEVMTWRNGRLVRLVNYQDFGSVLRALGVA